MKLNIKFILLFSINLILMNNLILSNYIMNLYPESGYLIHIILGIISVILVLFLPNNLVNIKEKILNNKYCKFFISITLLFIIIITISISIYHISERFFYLTPTFLIVLFIMYFIFLILKADINNLLNITLLSFIFIIIISSFHLFSKTRLDANFIKPFSFIFKNPLIIFSFIGFYLEGLIYIIPLNTKNLAIRKLDIIISIIIGSIISSFLLLQNTLYLTPSFFNDLNYPALYRFRLYFGPKYIEHFDNFLLLIISLFIIPKISLYLDLLRVTLNIKKSVYYRLGVFIFFSFISIFIFYNFGYNIKYLFIPNIIFTILTFIFYLFIIKEKHT